MKFQQTNAGPTVKSEKITVSTFRDGRNEQGLNVGGGRFTSTARTCLEKKNIWVLQNHPKNVSDQGLVVFLLCSQLTDKAHSPKMSCS